MHEAMMALTKATKSFLANRGENLTIKSLQLKLYLSNTFPCDIGPLVVDAIDSGLLKDLDLDILDEMEPYDCNDVDMLQRAEDMDCFFDAYPSVLHCLTRLSLYNVRFAKFGMHHILFDCCTQLKHLSLDYCDAGSFSTWKIDAPNSKLIVLELVTCEIERLDLVCLPKLEKLECNTWLPKYAPLSFGFVPSLGELHLINSFEISQHQLKLSELLHGTSGLHTLTLDFRGENLWMQPEIKQLRTAFNKLRKLSILGIFVEFDLVWTTALLLEAPSVEILHIQVWEHACDFDAETRQKIFRERRNPQWEIESCSSKNWLLRELQIVGFRPLEQQLTFIRAVLERASNLQTIVLKDDEQCEKCDALGAPPCSLVERAFPKSKDEQEMVVRRVKDGALFSGQVIFDDYKKL